MTLAELNAWYAEPPAADNAAGLYQEAFEALSSDPPTAPSFVANNQRALELLHRATSRTRCRYPIDLTEGQGVLLRHVPKIKTCGQLLSQAANNHAAKDRMDLAVQVVLDGLRLARSLDEEPLLVSQLARSAVLEATATGLVSVLNRRALSEEQLASLQAAFRDAETTSSFTRAMAAERPLLVGLPQMPREVLVQLTNIITGEGQRNQDLPDLVAYRESPAFGTDLDYYLDRMEEAVAASQLPFPESLDAFERWGERVKEAKANGFHFSRLLLPGLPRAAPRFADSLARLRVTQVALAVERYRLANARALPDSLDQLTPKFLEAVPLDPHTGRPLRYAKTAPRGFVVYSLGRDRTDDEGQPRPADAKPNTRFDIACAVRR